MFGCVGQLMKKVLIIYPHWPPSNLVGVHRVRLIANHLNGIDWEPTVLCVDEKDHEEPLAWETTQLVNPEVRVVKVRARKPLNFWGKRLVGDIGIRGLRALYKQAKCLLQEERFDCIWISIPSWYPALLGAPLSRRFDIPYGVDYQDPWVHEIPQERKGLNRATLTIGMAHLLEPIALRRVAFISGISDGYLAGIKKRHPRLKTIPFVSAQLGFSQRDHHIELPEFKPLLSPEKHSFVYAGAHWPMGAPLFSVFLKALQQLKTKGLISTQLEFVFIGTGSDVSPSIAEQARTLGIEDMVKEHRDRISYLEVQQTLREANGALVIGSVEAHYSASKIFQCLLTAPKVLGFFRPESEATHILEIAGANQYLQPYRPAHPEDELVDDLSQVILRFVNPNAPWHFHLDALQPHSAEASAHKIAAAMTAVCNSNKR